MKPEHRSIESFRIRVVVTATLALVGLLIWVLARQPLGAATSPVAGDHLQGSNVAQAPTQVPTPTSTPLPPGATDPIGPPSSYTLFPDDEVWVTTITQYTQYAQDVVMPGATLNMTGTIALNDGYDDMVGYFVPMIFATSGRITTQEYDQVVYARRDSGGQSADLFLNDRMLFDPVQTQSTYLGPQVDGYIDFLALAAGDLDKLADSAGNNHDEVVVVYNDNLSANTPGLSMVVFDYTDPSTATSHTPIGFAQLNDFVTYDSNLTNVLPIDTIVDVAIGDIDADGMNEIIVASVPAANQFVLSTFRYTNDGSGNRTITLAATNTFSPPAGGTYMGGSISVATGDLNGDGAAEVIVGLVVYKPESGTKANVNHGFAIFSSDPNLVLSLQGTPQFGGFYEIVNVSLAPKVKVLTGMFKYDPPNGFNFGQSQFVFVHNSSDGHLKFNTYAASNDLQSVSSLYSEVDISISTMGMQSYSAVAGEFRGVGDTQNPVWSVAYLTFPYETVVEDMTIGLIDVVAGNVTATTQVKNYCAGCVGDGNVGTRVPLVAFDYDGDSFFLGSPIQLTVEQVINTDTILYEPPKHAFYDSNPNATNNYSPTYQIVNVSRYANFNIQMTDSNGTSLASSSTDNSNWSIGGSVAVSAHASVETGDAEEEGAKISVEDTDKFGYTNDDISAKTKNYYSSRTVSYAASTDNDDWVAGRAQLFDIWRYRIYGVDATDNNNNPTNGFLDYIFPGPTTMFQGGGTTMDWYEPEHENGNILSYPQLSASDNGFFNPPDLGSFQLPGGQTYNGALLSNDLETYDSDSSNKSIQFNSSQGTNTSRTYSHTLTESVDVKTSFDACESEVLATECAGGSIDLSFNNSNSWSNTTTSTTTTNNAEGITLNIPAGSNDQAYSFTPVIYMSQDGTLKAAHAVVLPAPEDVSYWVDIYGQKSDPALALPKRYSWQQNADNFFAWFVEQDDDRKLIRGFSIIDANQNPISSQYDNIPSSIPAGEQVLLQANVYNYSVSQPIPSPLQVQFQIVQYDAGTGNEVGSRVTLGTATINTMQPLQVVPAQISWNTTGYGPATPCASIEYRFIVTLDPNNTIDELYDSENPNQTYTWVDSLNVTHYLNGIDPGQNNEGYSYINVTAPNPNGTCSPGFDADVFMKKSSVAMLETNGSLVTKNATALLNHPVRLRFTVKSNTPHGLYSYLMVYDGNPQHGKLIAMKRIHSGSPKGSHVWVDWTPTTPGKHKIVAQVLERRFDPVHGNNHDGLRVDVTACGGNPATPTLLAPSTGSILNHQRQLLKWEADSCATHYQVVLRKVTAKRPLVLKETALANTALKTPELKQGAKYVWRVRACRVNKCSDWSKRSRFEIAKE